MIPAAPLLALSLALSPADLESRAARRVTEEFERVGRSAPKNDPALARAARALAKVALLSSVADAAELLTLTGAVSDAGGADPNPRAIIVRGSPPEEPLRALLSRSDLPEEPATHAGVGAATVGSSTALVVLLAERKAEPAPFPRTFPKPGAVETLCAELSFAYGRAELYVTRPSGHVEKLPVSSPGESKVCGRIGFPVGGQHTVELIVRGERGPEVAALFFVQVGASTARAGRARLPEPARPAEARTVILERVNALRGGHGLAEVTRDEALEAIAQAYSDRMGREGFFAHVSPEGTDLRQRLRAAGYRYRTAGENLGMAGGPLAAHFGIEHSPGHRKNLLEAAYSRLGVGVSTRKLEGRTEWIVAEVLAAPAEGGREAGPGASPEEVYRALAGHRSALKLSPLTRSASLEQVASEHLRLAIELDEPKTQLPGFATHERVFALLDDVASASVDLVIAEAPAQVTDSKALADPRNRRVGVAVQRTDSAKFGNGRYWIVILYASPR